MTFPIIKNINDVLPAIKDFPEFIVVEKPEGYTYIDYVYVDNSSFDDPIRRECRGLIFETATGKILRRPLEKFDNYGERFSQDKCEWNKEHVVTDKRDGSMIGSFVLNGKVHFGTRAGITEHSQNAEKRHLTPKLESVSFDLFSNGFTPIWEWTSPENRIILDYKNDELRLLRIRDIETGVYMPFKHLEHWANKMGIDVVDRFEGLKVTPEWIEEQQKNGTGIEGFVIYWPHNEFSVKVKIEEYTKMHRAVSFLDRENMIMPVVLDNLHDDILPSLSPENQQKLTEYAIALHKEVNEEVGIVQKHMKNRLEKMKTRKEQALWINENIDKSLRAVYFSALDGKDILTTLKSVVIKFPEILLTRWTR